MLAILVGLCGGLALFLFGMDQLVLGLKSVAGAGMRTLLARLTTNRLRAVLTGAFVTGVIQSSSVTTVIMVGFISAGLMTMAQSVAVIIGANIGTTITAQILAFKVTKLSLPLIAGGFLLSFTAKSERWRQGGSIVLGLGLVFFGMVLMSDALYPLRSYPPFIDFMISMENPLLGAAIGAGFTAIVQSSSATTGISRPVSGSFSILPTKPLKRSSLGFTANWMFEPPVATPTRRMTLKASSRIAWYSRSDSSSCGGVSASAARPNCPASSNRKAAKPAKQVQNNILYFFCKRASAVTGMAAL